MDHDPIISVLLAADNEIIGRIRLQKIVYLLEQLGLNSGHRFVYHHYGPYSEDLSQTLLKNRIFGKSIVETFKTTDFGAEYSIYRPGENRSEPPAAVGDIPFAKLVMLVSTMKSATSVVIELAATIHWLMEKEKVDDWKLELKKRKGLKASESNISKAETLLADIELD